MSPQRYISIVVPVYQSVETLLPLFQRTETILNSLGKTFEFIYVLDGNNRESWSELLKIQKANEAHVRLFNLAKNYGQNAATICGINHALGEVIITMDDDLQTPPEEIAKLLEHYEKTHAEVIFGAPISRNRSPLRKFGAWFGRVWFKAVDGADIGTAFRLISPRIKDQLNREKHNLFLNQIIHWHTNDIDTIEVVNEPRAEGKSGYSFLGLLMIMVRLVFFYTDFPLKFISGIGALISIVCFGIGSFFIWEKITLGAEAGFASIIVALFFATGIILMALSVLGHFIHRIYQDRSNMPLYSVKTKV